MLMMRSTPVTKMGKPPPPVPPRPSKSLVAEALAKTRRLSPPETQKTAPIRTAPPPPPPEVVRTQQQPPPPNKKPFIIERSISEDLKCNNTRTVIFQSPRIENKKRIEVKKAESFRDEVKNKPRRDEGTMKKASSTNGLDQEVVQEQQPRKDDELTEDFGDKKWDQVLNDRNHVNTLIDEMFASVLEVSNEETTTSIVPTPPTLESPTTIVIVTSSDSSSSTTTSSTSTGEKKKAVQFDDRMNHELLISELESMRIEDEKILKRQRLPSVDIHEDGSVNGDKIQRSDWVEVNDGQEVRLSSCQITIEDQRNGHHEGSVHKGPKLDYERIKAMSSLHGLPPLPKSLSGFNLLDQTKPPTPVRTTSMRPSTNPFVYPPHPKVNGAVEIPVTTTTSGRKSTSLDAQLAILRREMYSLRQLDLSLLSQLWSLNESIQDFRQILQDQEDRVLSPPSPSPAPSSGDEGDGDEFYMSTASMNFRTPPPPPPVRRPSSSSNASSLG